MHHRAAVHLASLDEIVDHRNNSDASEHDTAVIHICDRRLLEQREEAHDGLLNAVEDSNDVDWDALMVKSANDVD